MINIVCFKWQRSNEGYRLNSGVYTANHVNILYNMVTRNTTVPFTFSCVTDDPHGIDKNINIVPLWNKCKNLGGCYNRLFIFSKEIESILGPRFACIDLDCVITNNIDDILERKEEFIINKFIGKGNLGQLYNGSLIMLTAGAREQVWSTFNYEHSPKILDKFRESRTLIGSDQAWIQYVLGTNEITLDDKDGVFDYSFLNQRQLPDSAKLVFFPGRVDPSTETENSWVKKYWK